jgi:hypothetical protein
MFASNQAHAVVKESVMTPEMVEEKLVPTWLDTTPDPDLKAYGSPYWLTAENDGIKLYTAPKNVMSRPAAHMPYREEKGLSCIFIGPDGTWRWSFAGEKMVRAYR